MTHYVFGKPGERARMTVSGLLESEIDLNLQDGEVCLVLDTVPTDYRISADGTSLEPREDTLEEERDRAIFEARRAAFDREHAGMTTTFGRIATDTMSQGRIAAQVSAAVVAKVTGADYSIDWRMIDNSYVTLDADAMMTIGTTLAAFINAVHVRKHDLLASIVAATTVDEVRSIDIDGGYPNKKSRRPCSRDRRLFLNLRRQKGIYA